MKYLNTFKKATPLLLLPVMGSAIAADLTVPLSFTTLPVIEIQEITPLAFGNVLSLTLSNTCTMSTAAGTALTPTQEGTDVTDTAIWTNTAQLAGLAGELTGDCETSVDGQVGVYEITSFQDANITVSVTAGTATEISFAPAGYVLDLDEATGDVTRETLAIGTDALVNASTNLTPYAQPGTNRVIVGGVLTNFATLTAGRDDYATDFNLDVVYQ